MPSDIRDDLTFSPFQQRSYVSFLSIALSKAFNTSGIYGLSCTISHLDEMLTFSSFPHVCYMAFIMLRCGSSIPKFFRTFMKAGTMLSNVL